MSPLGSGYRGGGCDLPGTVTLRLPWVFADSGPRKCSPPPRLVSVETSSSCALWTPSSWVLKEEGVGSPDSWV